ncbi:hypothetical protein U1Q18_044067 [Sarracenia purpurea var. burkii]
MAKKCNHNLPDECWELILNRLDHHSHLEAPSLACKRFLSITNELRTHFAVNPTIFIRGGTLSKLFARFRHLKSIDLSGFRRQIYRLILEIAVSDLKLESLDVSNNKCLSLECWKLLGSKMKSLRVLKCSYLRFFRDIELVAIAKSMPWLEELDISFPVVDLDLDRDGFPVYQRPLSPGEVGLTDEGIKVLLLKLGVLRKIDISGNHFLTDKSLFALSSNCVFLKEIVILRCPLVTQHNIEFVMRNNSQLSSISVGKIEISRSSLYYLPILDSFTSARGLSTLYIHDSLVPDEFLYSLAKAGFLLKRFSLSRCSNFTFSGISSLLYTHRSIEYLSFTGVVFVTDKLMSDLSKYLTSLTDSKVSYLCINGCMGIKNIGTGSELPKLEVFKAAKSGIDDEGLAMIGNRCHGIMILDLGRCLGATSIGLKEILRNCRRLREINLNGCSNMSMESVDWMGFSVPSLKKIAVSYWHLITESQRRVLLGHGCLVLGGMMQ